MTKKDIVARSLAAKKKVQAEAVKSAVTILKKEPRAQLRMACGSGKTITALRVAEAGDYRTILVLVPSLALVQQVFAEFREHTTWKKWAALCVCSDPGVVRMEDDIAEDELECDITNDAYVAEHFAKGAGIRVIFCTYQSVRKLQGFTFDLAIFDEAHKTAGDVNKPFGFALEDKHLRACKRLFLTATPRCSLRLENTADKSVQLLASMDNEKLYGKVAYDLPMRKAIDLGIIADYEVVIFGVPSLEGVDFAKASIVAVAKALQVYGSTKAFVFTHTIKRAEAFSEAFEKTYPGSGAKHITGEMTSRQRDNIMSAFHKAPRGLLCNARYLTEGVNVPDVDAVVFADPKKGFVSVVQALGRAQRVSAGKETVHLILPVFVESPEEGKKPKGFETTLDTLYALAQADESLASELRAMRGRSSLSPAGGETDTNLIQFVAVDAETQRVLNREIRPHLVAPPPASWWGVFQSAVEAQEKGGLPPKLEAWVKRNQRLRAASLLGSSQTEAMDEHFPRDARTAGLHERIREVKRFCEHRGYFLDIQSKDPEEQRVAKLLAGWRESTGRGKKTYDLLQARLPGWNHAPTEAYFNRMLVDIKQRGVWPSTYGAFIQRMRAFLQANQLPLRHRMLLSDAYPGWDKGLEHQRTDKQPRKKSA